MPRWSAILLSAKRAATRAALEGAKRARRVGGLALEGAVRGALSAALSAVADEVVDPLAEKWEKYRAKQENSETKVDGRGRRP